MMRAVVDRRTAVLLAVLIGLLVSEGASKTPREHSATEDVTLKVHLSDSSTHQSLQGASIQLFANHTLVTTETSLADGNAYLRFPYRLGTLLVVTATKQGYVPNSVPWTPSRLPVFSSISLSLLPERPATLTVYEDVVEIVSDFQGFKRQPSVCFQRRALSLPLNTSYANLTALLTVADSPLHIHHFPYLQVQGGNGTGFEKPSDLTPVAAVSVHLLDSDGTKLQVNEPITVSILLPADSGLKENDHVPAWRFDPRLGTLVGRDISMYHTLFLLAILGGMALILLGLLCILLYYCRRRCLKPRGSHRKLTVSSGLDSSKRDQATSMSHLNLINNEVHLELVSTGTEPDMTTPMLKPSPYQCVDDPHPHSLIQHSKHSRSSMGNSQQGSSLGNLTPHSKDYRQSVETVQLKSTFSCGMERGYRQSYTSICSSNNHISDGLSAANQGLFSDHQLSGIVSPSSPPCSPSRGDGCECRAPDYLLSRSVDHLERPPSLSRPGQLLCCASVDLLSGGETYPRVRPTLVIPAHYMRLPGEHPLSGQALLLQTDQQSDLETIQAELNASQPTRSLGHAPKDCIPGPSEQGDGEKLVEALSIPSALGDTSLVEINSEDTLLAEKTLMALRGGKPLPHPRAWFVSLDGRSNAHIRHSYIDLQRAGCHSNATSAASQQGGGRRHGSGNDASLDSGVDLNEPRAGRRGKDVDQEEQGVEREGSKGTTPTTAFTQLVYEDHLDGAGSKYDTQDSKLGSVQSFTGETEVAQIQKEPPSPSSSSTASSPPTLSPHSGVTLRNTLLSASPDDDATREDMEEEKKSPWQRREERPLLAFNLK
ncbi:protein FAM171A1 isoform X2 [Nerophis lumbriciformis]|uniref:protein FAM171A1 isoform X2 n=1 Tax=Nerophis lumbriciformis TaxID=546530 RepID=UPI002ADFCF84|nr:protein FAM171A1-like isoform X2 [Nerophis lumbriciformis]